MILSERPHVRRLICGVLLVVMMVAPQFGHATQPQVLTWDDLSPYASRIERGQSSDLAPHENGQIPGSGSDAALLQLDKFDPFNDGLLRVEDWEDNWEQDAYRVVPDLVDTVVRVDGHVLPLVWAGDRVTEFLLVPWVGACIHTPAPPPNQIIHISYPDGLQIKEQFEALRFTGRLRHAPARHNLFLIDGRRQIPVSYALTDVSSVGPAGKITSSAVENLPFVARAQIWANGLFTNSIGAISADGGYKALISAILLAFAYGVFHTFGPGHGKTVVVSYFVGAGGTMGRGIAMGVKIAIIHVLSAIVIVFAFDLAVTQTTGSAPSDYQAIRLASYGLIILIGATMLWRAVSHALAQRRQTANEQINAACNHHHAHNHAHKHAHSHAHVHTAGCSACAAAQEAAKGGGWVAASVGLVPCTGALLVMLYGLANDLMVPAILMVIAISAGMAVAMSTIGILAIWGRNLSEQRITRSDAERQTFQTSARLVGSTCVLAIGCLLFFLTLTRPLDMPPALGNSDVALQTSQGAEG